MNKKQFRFIVLFSLIFGLSAVPVGILGESSLPTEIQAYINEEFNKPLVLYNWVMFIIAIIVVISNIGLLFFRKWARNIYTISFIISCFGTLSERVIIQTGLEAILGWLSIFLSGMIIYSIHFSNVKEYFNKEKTNPSL